ncbi:tetratricopeptide repeat protein [Fundidesulfovibrio agrisoli]|uniref:tetratricopeptide repeat protein n=1 Tax=Fundidesulfovibrio agrisoli TaxID=2922717 RepID=UPI001FAC1971|nr:tetratricopeptide repeat protein [Fundidesulfovibrio agrisoli]
MADITFDRPDQQMSPLAKFFFNNWRIMAVMVIAVVVATAGYAWYASSVKQSKIKAENELGAIIASKTGPERLTALEAYLKSAPASTKGATLLEIANTAQEQGQFDKAAEAWNQLYLSAPEGMREIAGMGYATAIAQKGDKLAAVKFLVDMLPKAPKPFQPVVARQLASLAEEAKAWDEAISAYERMKDLGMGGNKAFYEAKIAELKAKKQ